MVIAGRAFWLLDSYIYGFVVQETSLRFTTQETARPAGALPQSLPDNLYPHLAEMAAGYVTTTPDHNYAAEFEFGLDLILDGLDKHRQDQPSVS